MEKIRPKLMNMEVGDEVIFPIEKMKSVRVEASELGAIMDRIYETHSDRIRRTLTVIRIK
jgi:hemerythrin superfamily protein